MINEFRSMNHLTSLQNFICTIGNLPTSYALSLSYEEQVWWLCNFLETKIFPAIENNTEITEETQKAFLELQQYVTDYFNNLDVQEEINNKLDDMAEKGLLQEIINLYLQSNCLWSFNNVNDMKNATNLRNGSKCKTLGYYVANDGGDAEYLIRTKNENDVDDGGSIHVIGDLVAELIVKDDEIIVNQFGAYGDGIHNDTIYIQKAIDFSINQNYNPRVKLLDKVYCISNLAIKPKTKLIGSGIENTKLLIEDGSNGSALLISENEWHYCYLSDFSISCRSSNNNVTNAIEINVNNHYYDSYSTFENLRIFYIPNGNRYL